MSAEQTLINQLSSLDWESLWVRLMARCYWVIRKRYGIEWSNSRMKDFSREIIQEVFDKIFIEKSRNWNKERYPDFEDFIIGVIDSHINNTLNKSSVELDISDESLSRELNQKLLTEDEEPQIAHDLRQSIFSELEAMGAEDDELLIFECLADGIYKPDSIKLELGMEDVAFQNAWRRLNRKRKKIEVKILAYGN